MVGGGAIHLQGGALASDPAIFAIAGAVRADGGSGVGAAEAGSGGSVSIFTGWRVIIPNTFTCIVNSGGVRSAHPSTIESDGSR